MNGYLLDTNHGSWLLEGGPAAAERLREKSGLLVATSVIVAGELLFMATHSERRTANLANVQAFLSGLHIYNINAATSEIYADLKAGFYARFGPRETSARRRTTIQDLGLDDNDLWIAATAVQHNLTIVSADADFPRIAQVRPLSLESWHTP